MLVLLESSKILTKSPCRNGKEDQLSLHAIKQIINLKVRETFIVHMKSVGIQLFSVEQKLQKNIIDMV